MVKPEIMFPIPYLERKKKLPTILTKEEVLRIIEHATTLKYNPFSRLDILLGYA